MLPRYETKLRDIRTSISSLLSSIIVASKESLRGFEENRIELYESARDHLKTLQTDANAIDNEIIKTFALFGPEAQELRLLVAYLKMTNDLDRIGDATRKYAKRLEEHCKSECDLSVITNTIVQLHKTALNALQYIHECLIADDACDADELYRKVMVEESKNDDLFSILEKDLLNLIITSGELSVEYVKVLGTIRKLERTCDRAVNIAALLLFAQNGGQMHMYN
ncbi:MAG: PhoU domain-containing protein [Sulfuricurvum sp.]|nr:PhoU domain-containing protein [Sulfuricurvum sp.]MDP3023412.1 PhoU domain-containing protein [Sulfuricurvum sp.]MDP3119517.1 PhoU domain-containing protein [Sulfuricurvum sp.]